MILNETLHKSVIQSEIPGCLVVFCRIYEFKDSGRVLGARRMNEYEGKTEKKREGVGKTWGLENVQG